MNDVTHSRDWDSSDQTQGDELLVGDEDAKVGQHVGRQRHHRCRGELRPGNALPVKSLLLSEDQHQHHWPQSQEIQYSCHLLQINQLQHILKSTCYRKEYWNLKKVDLAHHLLEHDLEDGGASSRGRGEDHRGQYGVVRVVHVGQERDADSAENESHDPDSNKLLSQHHPGHQIHEGSVGGEQGGDHGALKHEERFDVEIVGENREEAEDDTAQQQTLWRKSFNPVITTTIVSLKFMCL